MPQICNLFQLEDASGGEGGRVLTIRERGEVLLLLPTLYLAYMYHGISCYLLLSPVVKQPSLLQPLPSAKFSTYGKRRKKRERSTFCNTAPSALPHALYLLHGLPAAGSVHLLLVSHTPGTSTLLCSCLPLLHSHVSLLLYASLPACLPAHVCHYAFLL